jgi:hypothetical protein
MRSTESRAALKPTRRGWRHRGWSDARWMIPSRDGRVHYTSFAWLDGLAACRSRMAAASLRMVDRPITMLVYDGHSLTEVQLGRRAVKALQGRKWAHQAGARARWENARCQTGTAMAMCAVSCQMRVCKQLRHSPCTMMERACG